jgi:hypothetical protein
MCQGSRLASIEHFDYGKDIEASVTEAPQSGHSLSILLSESKPSDNSLLGSTIGSPAVDTLMNSSHLITVCWVLQSVHPLSIPL